MGKGNRARRDNSKLDIIDELPPCLDGIIIGDGEQVSHDRASDAAVERSVTLRISKGKHWIAARTVILSFCSYGVGRDMDGKALFIAQTGALKAWLKRLGLIFGEWDDPEVESGEERPRRETTALASYQERAWSSALKSCGKTADQIDAYLSDAMARASVKANHVFPHPASPAIMVIPRAGIRP
jgi:hypothetical protein